MKRSPSWQPAIDRATRQYLVLQGTGALAWWIMLAVVPTARPWFFPPALGPAAIVAIAVPDVLLFGVGSLLAALAIQRRWRLARALVAAVGGAAAYATLWCGGAWIATGHGALSVAVMSAALVANGICIWLQVPERALEPFFATSTTTDPGRCLRRTLAQMVIFWTTFLVILPAAVVALERRAGVPSWAPHVGWRSAAVVLFAAASALGIVSATLMALRARGTPVPLAAPNRLIVTGPYRYVRNPMAIAGIAQGIAVGLWLHSVSVVIYAILGAFVWNALARPLEEDDLVRRFGAPFEAYRRAVRCWWPRLTPYQPAPRDATDD